MFHIQGDAVQQQACPYKDIIKDVSACVCLLVCMLRVKGSVNNRLVMLHLQQREREKKDRTDKRK